MPKRILIVENNEKNRQLLAYLLKYNGYEVMEAMNGEEGIAMTNEHKPDLILMDLHMPVIDGYKAMRMIRNNPETKDIKIIALTSSAMNRDREKALEAGFDDYFTKPIDTRQFPEVIKRLLL